MTSNSSVVSQRCNHTLCDLADEIRTQPVIRSTKMQCMLLDISFFSTIKRKMLNAPNSFKNMKSNWSTSAFHKLSAPLYSSVPDLSCQDSASLGVSLKKLSSGFVVRRLWVRASASTTLPKSDDRDE